MAGRGVFSKAVTIYFGAEVGPLLRGRNLSVVLIRNAEFTGFFRVEKPYRSGFLVVHSVGDPENPVTDVWDMDEARCVELVRAGRVPIGLVEGHARASGIRLEPFADDEIVPR